MKIIFLDVDGVLNSAKFAQKMFKEEGVRIYAEDILDGHALSLLADIVKNTGAKIVVSSSWRRIPESIQNLKDWLAKYGMEVYDSTPSTGMYRGDDITAWFNRHPGEHQYAILDDDSDMTVHKSHLVQTEFYTGLTRELADRCIELLNA